MDSLNSDGKESPKKWSQILNVCIVSIIVVTSASNVGWPAPSLPKLLSDEYPFEVTEEEASYITIIANLGTFFGSFIGYLVLDRIGRKNTVLLIAPFLFIGYSLICLSYELMELLYIARFISGLGDGMINTTVLLYIGEIADPAIRGVLSGIASIAFYLGILAINLIGSFLSIKVTAGIFVCLPILFVITFSQMPETPYYLIMKNKDKEAEKVLKFLRRKSNVDDELTTLKKDVKRQMSESGSLKDIFTIDSNKNAFFLTLGARFFQLATGVATFSFYLQLLLKSATGSLEPYIGSSIILFIQMAMTLVTCFIVDKLGRKLMLLFSSVGCFLSLLLQTVFYILKEHTSVDVSSFDWFPLAMMILLIIFYSLGYGSVVSILVGEMFSASIKRKSACVVNAFYALVNIALTKFYQVTADNFGLMIPFASFSVLTFLGVLFVYFLLPETKGKSLEQIQEILKKKEKKSVVM